MVFQTNNRCYLYLFINFLGPFGEETELLAENSALLPKKCVHLKSGVNPTSVKKKLKQFSRRCEVNRSLKQFIFFILIFVFVLQQCEKLNVFDENEIVWICLNCGHRVSLCRQKIYLKIIRNR